MEEHQIDLVHLNNQINRDLFGVFAAQRRKIPCISHLRSHRSEHFDYKRARFPNSVVSRYIAATRSAADHWIDRGVTKEKTMVVYNGIPEQLFVPVDLYKRFGIDQKRTFLFGCVGTLNEVKGHGFLLDCFSRFIDRYPECGLLLIGDGPLKEQLNGQIKNLGLEKHIYPLGHQKDAGHLIASVEALLLPSKKENCSRVLLEGMLASTPILATDVGGNPELIEDQVNGLLAPYGNIEAFVNKMERLYTEKNMRDRFAENGLNKVLKQFTLTTYVTSIEEIYNSIFLEKE